MTEAGKTRAAVSCSLRYRDRGIPRIILDPLNDPRWEIGDADFITREPSEFAKVWKDNKQCCLVVDESSRSIGRYAGEMQEVVSMSRHWGHEAHIIAQRPQQMDPIIREMLSEVYLFRSSPSVSKIFADEFAARELLQATEIPLGHFYLANRSGKVVKCQIDYASGAVSYV